MLCHRLCCHVISHIFVMLSYLLYCVLSCFAVMLWKGFISGYQIIFTWSWSCFNYCCFLMIFYSFVGTLRPDLIESASSLASNKAEAIKTHHNDTDFVRALRAQVRITIVNIFADTRIFAVFVHLMCCWCRYI